MVSPLWWGCDPPPAGAALPQWGRITSGAPSPNSAPWGRGTRRVVWVKKIGFSRDPREKVATGKTKGKTNEKANNSDAVFDADYGIWC